MATLSSSVLRGQGHKRSLFAHVVEEIGSRIVSGALKPNDPLPNEAVLGREFGASNALLLQVGNLIGVGLLVSYRLSKDPLTVFLARHKQVLVAIRRRRQAAARAAMDRLLVETRDFLESHFVDDEARESRKARACGNGSSRRARAVKPQP